MILRNPDQLQRLERPIAIFCPLPQNTVWETPCTVCRSQDRQAKILSGEFAIAFNAVLSLPRKLCCVRFIVSIKRPNQGPGRTTDPRVGGMRLSEVNHYRSCDTAQIVICSVNVLYGGLSRWKSRESSLGVINTSLDVWKSIYIK
jgi:hypothetical protein